MRKLALVIGIIGLSLFTLMGCGTQEMPPSTNLELPSTWTPFQTDGPLPSLTRIPTRIIPSATPQSVITYFTPTPSTVIEDVFVREGTPVPQLLEEIGVENVSRLVELARWGYGGIQNITHTIDGQLMLVQTNVGVYAYRVGTLEEVWRFIPDVAVQGIFVEADDIVKVQLDQAMISVLDSDSGQVINNYHGNLDFEQAASGEAANGLYHSDGKIYRSSDDTVLLDFEEIGISPWLYFAGISPSGNYVVFISEDAPLLAVYRINDGEFMLLYDPENLIAMVDPHYAKPTLLSGPGPDIINSFLFNRSEQFLIAANGRDQIFFFDLSLGETHMIVHGNGSQLVLPPYGDSVIYYDCDTIEYFAIPSGEREAEINFGSCSQEIEFSPGSTRIVQGGTLWNLQNGTYQTMPENEKIIGFSVDGGYTFSIRDQWWWVKRRTTDLELNYQVYLDLTPDPSLGGWEDYSTDYWIVGLHWDADQEGIVLIGGWYGVPYLIWRTDNGEIISVGLGASEYDQFALSPDGTYLLDVGDGMDASLLERQSDGSYTELKWIEAWGQDIDFIGNQYLLLTDIDIEVYSLPEMELIKRIEFDDMVRAAAVSPNGQLVAATTGDEVIIFNFETGEVLRTLDVRNWGAFSLEFSPDGRYLAAASSSGVIQLWGIYPDD